MVRMITEADIPKLSTQLTPNVLDAYTSPDANSSDIHVLAVDDSLVDRKVVEKLLKTSAFKVTTVESGSRALELLGVGQNRSPLCANAYGINLIITDYCMPGMTGYDLLKRVKEISALKEIPVVIMSSENVPDRIQRCLAEGAEEFILKPLQLSDVKRLRGRIYQTKLRTTEQSRAPTCIKRKASTEPLETKNTERRPRLDVVTVP